MNAILKQFWTFIKFWLKQVVYLLLALSLLGGLFYLRLIPRVSRSLWENMNYAQISITLLSMLLLSIHIYTLLKILGYIPEKDTKYLKSVKDCLLQIQTFITEILYNFYLFFWNILELMVNKITRRNYLIHYSVIRWLSKKFNKKPNFKYYCWLLISINFVSKILFVIAFTNDVLIYQRLDYTFKALPLLLIPLIERFIIFVFQEFYDMHYANVCSFIEKKPIIDSELMNYSFVSEYKETPPNFVKDFYDFFFNHYLVFRELRENLEFYEFWKYKVFPTYLVDLFLLSIRLLLFTYILIHGLT